MRRIWIIPVVIGGALLISAVAYFGSLSLLPKNLGGPVAIVKGTPPQHGFLGVEFGEEKSPSLIIRKVLNGSDAATVLKVGDAIVAVEAAQRPDPTAFQRILQATAPGQVLNLEIERNKKRLRVRVKLMSFTEMLVLSEQESNWIVATEVQPVTYSQLLKVLQGQQGKIVVVYYWTIYSVPDKHMFPGLVGLHNKHAKSGVTALTVSLTPDLKGNQDAIKKFVASQKTSFPNLALNDDSDVLEKLNINVTPAISIHDREGKVVETRDVGDPRLEGTNLFGWAEEVVGKLLAAESR